MMVSTVEAVVQLPGDPRLHGASVDEPTVGQCVETAAINVWGWVLGRTAPVLLVEVVSDLGPSRRALVSIDRPHVNEVFPDVPDAARSGFAAVVDVRGARRKGRFVLEAVLSDRSRVVFGAVHVRHSWCCFDAEVADLVSVVIGSTGEERAMSRTARSISAQTYHRIEQVVVPAEEAGPQYGGIAAQRNAGVRCSSGDLLVFLDAGATLEPDAIAKGVRSLRRDPALAAIHLRERRPGPGGAVLYRRAALHSVGYFRNERSVPPDRELIARLERHAIVGSGEIAAAPSASVRAGERA